MTESSFHEDFREIDEEKEIFFNIINRYVGFYTRQAHKRTRNNTSSEYPFLPMDSRQVYAQIDFVKRYLDTRDPATPGNSHSFLDVGCGIGNILLIAEEFRFEVFGLEKDEYPFAMASELIGQDRIFREDIRNYKNYGDFDVIYYYCPLTDGPPQMELEILIEDQMKPGAILIANHKRSRAIEQDPRFRKLSRGLPVWEKASGQQR
ncbi:MAG TPA: class I SAM-dependent methyltransferase [Thermodesulfobacteriaceae bacterium]|nr:class I SAM-dependent methyltransferase [Thermodesulfobacteriaceae bacterium]